MARLLCGTMRGQSASKIVPMVHSRRSSRRSAVISSCVEATACLRISLQWWWTMPRWASRRLCADVTCWGSTARQLYLQDLLGYEHPEYAHVPLLVAPDGRRLSKRDRDLDMGELRARFDTPEALLGKLACAVGLRCDAAPCSAERLVEGFTWDWVREHPGDIVVAPGFLG